MTIEDCRLIRVLARLLLLAAALACAPAHAVDWAAGKATYNANCIGCHHVRYGQTGDFPAGAAASVIQSKIDNPTSAMGAADSLKSFRSGICAPSGVVCPALTDVAAYLANPTLVRASPDSLTFADALVGVPLASVQVNLINGGNLDMAVTQATVSPNAGGEFTVTPSACAAVKEDQSCAVTVSFTPRSVHGAGQATLTFMHNTATTALAATTVAIAAGAGLDPLQPSSTALAFRSALGVPATQSLTLHNASTAAVTLTDLKIGATSGAAATYAVDPASDCVPNAKVAGGGTCTLVLVFNPSALGSSSAVASVSYLGTRRDIALSGAGVDANLQFGPTTPPLVALVGHPSAISSVTVTNLGSTDAVLGVPVVAFGSEFSIVHGAAGDCDNARLTARTGTCRIRLQYLSAYVWNGERGLVSVPHDSGPSSDFMVTGSALELATTPGALALVALPSAVVVGQLVVSNPTSSTTFLGPIDASGLAPGFSLATNSCPASLGPQSSCTLQIRYAPAASAQVSGVLKLQYGPAVATDTAHVVFVSVVGSAQPAPFVSTTPTTLRFAPTAPGQSSLLAVTISNLGSAVLNISGLAIDGAAAADFGVAASTCSAPFAPGASCSVQVRFQPAAWRSGAARLVITHDAPGAQSAVALTGQAWAGLAPQSLAFGHVVVGASSAALQSTLTNSGNLDLNIGTFQVAGNTDGAFVSVPSSCQPQAILAPGASCTLAWRFAPTAAGGRSADVQIRHSATGGPLMLALAGVGDPPAVADVQSAPDSVDFAPGRIGVASQPVQILLRNSGTAVLNLTNLAVAGGQAADFATAGSCRAGTPLAVGGSCTISVVFTPSRAGASAAQLVIDSNALRGRVDIALRGSASAAPRLGASATSLDFGAQPLGSPPAQGHVALRNLGDSGVTLASVATAGAGFTGTSTCGGMLPPGARCDVTLRFDPQTDQGDYTGQVTIASDAPGSVMQVGLSGRGAVAPVPALTWLAGSGADRDFGSVPVGGRSMSQRLVLVNSGHATAHVQDIVLDGSSMADFTTTSTCASRDLAPGMSCDVQVVFQPRSSGAKVASLRALPSGTGLAALVLTGMSPPSASPAIMLSATAIDFGNAQRGVPSPSRYVTLRNQGSVDVGVQGLEMDGPFRVDSSACGTVPFVLRAGMQCQLGIVFVPVAGGEATGTLVVQNDAGAGGVALALRGNGIGP